MSFTLSTIRPWLLIFGGFCALVLAGVVLSGLIWNGLADKSDPCSLVSNPQVLEGQENLQHAAALLSPQAPEIRLRLNNIFQFPFDHACVIPHGTSLQSMLSQLGTPWDCAQMWHQRVLSNDTYLSLIVVSGETVIPVRLNTTDFDVANAAPARIPPHAELQMSKRPGTDQVLLRFP